MHIRHAFKIEYTLIQNSRRSKLQEIKVEKDLGVYTTDDLKPSVHCAKATSLSMSVLYITCSSTCISDITN